MLTYSKMMKIDVNKSGRIFDFLVSTGMLRLSYDPNALIPPQATNGTMTKGSLMSTPLGLSQFSQVLGGHGKENLEMRRMVNDVVIGSGP
jgi:hypothetical protein